MQIKLSHIDFPRQIVAVTSKSVAHRMLICAAFCNYASRFKFKRVGEDIHRTIDCLCNLGAGIEKMKESENGDLEFSLQHSDAGFVGLDHGKSCGNEQIVICTVRIDKTR